MRRLTCYHVAKLSTSIPPNRRCLRRCLVNDLSNEVAQFKELARVPADRVRNFRNDMYLVSEALRWMQKSGTPQFTPADRAVLTNYKQHIDHATKFIPGWVKVAVGRPLGIRLIVWGESSGGEVRRERRQKRLDY